MNKILQIKKKLIQDLSNLLLKNKFIQDIWMYGSFKDKTSDLDLILIYKENPIKINFPRYIKKLIADGNVIFANQKNCKQIFLFEKLNVYSIKEKKKITVKLKKEDEKFRNITSFLERYYYARLFLNKNKNKFNDINFRNIKSLFFSYKTFFLINNKKILYKKFRSFEKNYYGLRKKYNNNTLGNQEYLKFIKYLKIFDQNFSDNAFIYFEKKFKYLEVKNHTLTFSKLKKFNYKNNHNGKKNKMVKIPKIFSLVYFFYALQPLKLSKEILNSFEPNIICDKLYLNNFFSKKFKNYLLNKINFLNFEYKRLKKNKFKGGLYRFGWYL